MIIILNQVNSMLYKMITDIPIQKKVVGFIIGFINQKEANFFVEIAEDFLKNKTNLIGKKFKDYIKDLSQRQKDQFF